MTRAPHVAVLGAGILGCCLALELARRGARVTLFDAAAAPMSAASRWNEGKIHLGHLYGADPSLRTARHVLPGGLAFRPIVEDLLGCRLAPVTTGEDDLYLCHRDSVVAPDAMEHYMARVTDMVRAHPDAGAYLADASGARSRRLSPSQLDAVADTAEIVAGFTAPERSVRTGWVADRFVEAVAAQRGVEPVFGARVLAAQPVDGSPEGAWRVETSDGAHAPFDRVVNALWEGRMAVDRTAGLAPEGVWSNRYRLSLFLRTTRPLATPSAVIATGPFGDVKNYDGREFYLSWYPEGLHVESAELQPPDPHAVPMPAPDAFRDRVLGRLEAVMPWVAGIRDCVEHASMAGGWVFAAGRGLLSDPSSTLHRRSSYGVTRRGSYFSVDTGKYSTAPWTARALAADLL